MPKKALRILTKSGATLIAPLGDTDAGDTIPSLDEIGVLVNTAIANVADPWLTLNTMETKVLAPEVLAFGIIDYDPEAIARAQLARSQQNGTPPAAITAQTSPVIPSTAPIPVQTSPSQPLPTAAIPSAAIPTQTVDATVEPAAAAVVS